MYIVGSAQYDLLSSLGNPSGHPNAGVYTGFIFKMPFDLSKTLYSSSFPTTGFFSEISTIGIINGTQQIWVAGSADPSNFPLRNGYVDNTLGAVNAFLASFEIDTIKPIIATSFANNTVVKSGYVISFNFTDRQTGLDNYTFSSNVTTWGNGPGSPTESMIDYFDVQGPEGLNVLTVDLFDNSGNLERLYIYFIIDDTAPSINVTNYVNNSLINSQINLTYLVVDTSNLTTNIYQWNTGLSGNINVNGTIPVPSIEGSYELQIQSTDIAGNTANVLLVYTIDNTAPTLAITNYANNTIINSSITLIFTAQDTHSIVNSTYQWNGSGVLLISGLIPVPTNDGDYTLVLKSTDLAGNVAEKTYIFSIDTTSPDISISGLLNGTVVNSLHNLSYLAQDNHTILSNSYQWNGSSSYLISNSASIPVPSAEGSFLLTLISRDVANNTKVVSFILVIDNTAPTINISNYNNNSILNSMSNLSFTSVDTHTIVNSTYQWSGFGELIISGPITVPTVEGDYALLVKSTDIAGNIAQKTYTFSIDTTAPIITLFGLVNNSVYNSMHNISYHAQDNYTIQTNSYQWSGTVINVIGNTSSISLPSREGNYNLTLISVDSVGNSRKKVFFISIDNTAPLVNISNLVNSSVISSSLYLRYNASDLHLYSSYYSWNDSALTSFQLGDRITLPSIDGHYEFLIFSNDSAGNVGKLRYYIIIDDTAPTIVQISPESGSTISIVANQTLTFQFNITDKNGLASTFYLINETGNYLFTPGENISLLVNSTKFTINVFAIDIAGNIANKTIEIEPETPLPAPNMTTQQLKVEQFDPIVILGVSLVVIGGITTVLVVNRRSSKK